MQDEIFDEIDSAQTLPERYLGLTWYKLIFSLLLVLALGIYIGVLLFGDNSLDVLLNLEEYETYLQDEIHRLKQENAALQKEYFELKELQPDN